LKWRCIGGDSITVEERFCRGDWDIPKTQASAATIGVEPAVIHRIRQQRATGAGPEDLVFPNRKGGPMSDQNILARIVKPAAMRLGIKVNWQILRRSHCTWLVQSGADVKSIQGQMRHSRISTTLDIYAQIVSSAQQQAIGKLAEFFSEKKTCHTAVTQNCTRNRATMARAFDDSMSYAPTTTALKRLASAVQLSPWPPCFQRLTSPAKSNLVTLCHTKFRAARSLHPTCSKKRQGNSTQNCQPCPSIAEPGLALA
jgi:hypothetical protein